MHAKPGRIIASLCVFAVGAAALLAADDDRPVVQKPAWQWTVEERLAERFDAVRIAERQLEERRRRDSYRARSAADVGDRVEGPLNYSINGSLHPELFLPHELFDALVTAVAPDTARRERQREGLHHGLVKMGFDAELFWNELERVAGEYVELQYGQSESRPVEKCQRRFAALRAARAAFGQDRFDQVLYEVVAPLTRAAYASSSDESAYLRRVAYGCF